MTPSRRDALKLFGAAAFGTASFASDAGTAIAPDARLYPGGQAGRLPIVQGATDRSSAAFILLVPSDAGLAVDIRDGEGRAVAARIVNRFDLPLAGVSTIEMVATGLVPRRDFSLTVIDDAGASLDRRIFQSLETDRPTARFAVASCMDERFGQQAITMWEAMAREAPDFVVLLGNTCYADRRNPERNEAGYARRYAETRLALSWFRFERLVPTFAVWDDHDFGADNADRSFRHASFTRQLFDSFWGTAANAAWHRGFGVGSRIEAFDQRFYLMDDRTYRDPPRQAGGRQWGAEQTDWLFSELSVGDHPSWIMNGGQFFGRPLFMESMEGNHPDELREIVTRLSSIAAPVALVSGDVHFSAISAIGPERFGYPTYEFTSSSIHSTFNPGPIRRGNLVAERRHNFMVFDVDTRASWQIGARAVLGDNAVAFAQGLTISR
jgi:alkaline phosphatase D